MNADSGFIVKSKVREINRQILPPEIIYPFEQRAPIEGEEIIYWRKNYGLTETILQYCKDASLPNENGKYLITQKQQIYNILEIIADFMNEAVWKNSGDSMWTYDEVLPYLRQNIDNLIVMMNFMKYNSDIYLVFYY
jgi:hypothetical protein